MRFGKYKYVSDGQVSYLVFCKNSNGKYICSFQQVNALMKSEQPAITMKYDSHKNAFIGIEDFLHRKSDANNAKLTYLGSI